MKWELVNPSDPYTVESDNFKCAAIAAILVGQGKYALDPIEGTNKEFSMPIFLFGGHDEWFKEHFHESVEAALDDCMETKAGSLIAALRSISIADEKRSSMNNIGAYAQEIAANMEAKCSTK
jgi:hypothetical protein